MYIQYIASVFIYSTVVGYWLLLQATVVLRPIGTLTLGLTLNPDPDPDPDPDPNSKLQTLNPKP